LQELNQLLSDRNMVEDMASVRSCAPAAACCLVRAVVANASPCASLQVVAASLDIIGIVLSGADRHADFCLALPEFASCLVRHLASKNVLVRYVRVIGGTSPFLFP